MNAYFLHKGIEQLATELNGNEHIYLGIRPYGFHAGNMIPHVIYPLLLCRELQKNGKKPEFKIFLFINDWEQDRLAGPNTRSYPFNIFPLNTTFQHATNPDNPSVSIVDYWQPTIAAYVGTISESFPEVSVKTIRNSEMKKDPIMERDVLFAIRHPDRIGDILRGHTKFPVLDKPLSFVLAVCLFCRQAKGKTSADKDDAITHKCSHCGKTSNGPYEAFDYWFYHKPLAVPRLEICNIDICITGGDHFKEGDLKVREELIKLFGSKAKFPKTLYTPLLLAKDGQVMGKSRGNAEMISVEELLALVTSQPDTQEIQLPREFKSFNMSDTMTAAPSRPAF